MGVIRVAAWLVSIALVILLIAYGKSFLIPIFLALFIWYLVNAIDSVIRGIPFVARLPNGITLSLSFVVIGYALYNVGDLIVATVNDFILTSGNYTERIDDQIAIFYELLRLKNPPSVESLDVMSSLSKNALSLLNGLSATAKNFFLVLIYVIFLLLEQGAFVKKLDALGLSPLQSGRLTAVLNQINWAMRTYLGVKTFTSLLTAFLSYFVFWALDLDYALFWAFLIFLFNYIPSIGSIVATFLPAFLALLQFEGISAFLIIALGVSAIQVAVGNILEPRLMGSNLNISPLVVILSLVLWASLWGVVGMLLCVPITVAIIIICSQFSTTRYVAILLSGNGELAEITRQNEEPAQ